MNSYFADTSLFVAFLNPRDEHHELAVAFIRDELNFLVTSTWVLVELGNFFSKSRTRRRFFPFVRDLGVDLLVDIVPPAADLFEKALHLYHRRADKPWSMTDCTSFLIMRARGLSEALTTDHHMVQAGFKILLT